MSFEALGVAANALRSQRLGLDVAARNLAAADEAGYTRQSTITSEDYSAPAGRFAQEVAGLGARLLGVERSRNQLADTAVRSRMRDNEAAGAAQRHLQQLQSGLTGEPGLSQLLQEVSTGLNHLQGDPGNLGLRQAFFSQLEASTARLRGYNQELVSNRQAAREDLAGRVDRANELLSQVAQINPRIVAAERNTTGANGLLDQRDRLIDELSGLLDTQVLTQPSGEVQLYVNGRQLVVRDHSEKLSLLPDHRLQTESGVVLEAGGGIGGLQKYLAGPLVEYQSQLDSLASSLVSGVNEVHRNTYGLDGLTGRDLLKGSAASDIAVALSDPRQLGHAVARLVGQPLPGPLNEDQPLVGGGVLRVNGTDVAWSDGDTLRQVMDSLTTAGVRASFNPSTRAVTLERNPGVAGPSGITVSDVSGNLSSQLGLDAGILQLGGQGDTAGLHALQEALRSPRYGSALDRTAQQATRDLQAGVGADLASVEQVTAAAASALEAAQATRRSQSGVSSDEELLHVTRLEQAFAAAARVAQAADEMLTTLMQIGR